MGLPEIVFQGLLLGRVQLTSRQAILGQVQGAGDGAKVHGRELSVAVIGEMAAGAIQLQPADVRRVHRLVAAPQQLLLDKGLQQAADSRSLGHPQDESAAHGRTDGEKVELLAQDAVIAFLGFFELFQVGIEVLLAEKRRPVQAL